MADMTAAQVAEWMQAQGLEVPADVQAKADTEKTSEVESYLYDRLSSITSETDRIAAAEESREFFETVAAHMMSFDSQEKNKPGRGDNKYRSHFVGIETPAGFLKVELQRSL